MEKNGKIGKIEKKEGEKRSLVSSRPSSQHSTFVLIVIRLNFSIFIYKVISLNSSVKDEFDDVKINSKIEKNRKN